MLAAVTTAISQVITWVGTVITALVDTTGELNALLPLFAIGIAISAVLLGKLVAEFKSGEFGETLFKTIPSQDIFVRCNDYPLGVGSSDPKRRTLKI